MTGMSNPARGADVRSAASEPSGDVGRLTQSNLEFLRQGRELVRSLSDEQYRDAPKGFSRGGVGAHVRHIVDHYDCFLRGAREGRVNYDARARDTRVESERGTALERLDDLCARLAASELRDPARSLEVTANCGEPGPPAVGCSSVGRELQFLASHTVHHFAVVAAMLRSLGVQPDRDLGVAPSTLAYERGDGSQLRDPDAVQRDPDSPCAR